MTTATEETTSETTESKNKDYQMVAVSLPLDLAKLLEDAANAETPKVSVSVMLRRIVAEDFDYDITEFERSRRRGRVKYGSEEERANAQRQRAAVVKALFERYNKGEIELDQSDIDAAAASIKPRTPKTAAKATK